ncbi:MAG: helix-turn-helix domain-containing protein [Gemmatimonadota bacterium]|jgi:AcrR family transcriptional regulator
MILDSQGKTALSRTRILFYPVVAMVPEASPPHVHAPKQSRSRRTLERIVRASLALLEEGGPDALTVQAIVKRAGSSVGSFYARFDGKDELLEYLGERVWREAAQRWDEALAAREWSSLDLRGMIDGSVRLLSDVGRSRASALRALERTPGARDDAYRAFHAHVLRGVEEMLMERAHEITHPRPSVAIPLALQAALSILDSPAGSPAAAVPEEERMEEASRLLLAHLTGDASTGGPRGDVDFFDIWG